MIIITIHNKRDNNYVTILMCIATQWTLSKNRFIFTHHSVIKFCTVTMLEIYFPENSI